MLAPSNFEMCPPLQHLLTLLAVAEAGSITRAARELQTAQSAVSRSVRELERGYGARLLVRSARGVTPTEAGQAVLARARAIRAEATAAQREVQACTSTAAPQLCIGVTPTAAAYTLPRALQRWQGAILPRLQVVEGTYELLLPQLARGALDGVFGPLDAELVRGFNGVPLYSDDLVVIAGPKHPLCASERVEPAALAAGRWILPPVQSELWSDVANAFATLGLVPPEAELRTESAPMVRACLRLSPYLSLLPRDLVKLDCRHGLLEVVRTPPIPHRRTVGLIVRASERPSSALAPFLKALSEDAMLLSRK